MQLPAAINQCWSMDFMCDTMQSGRKFRTLNIVDNFSRECLAIEVDTSLPGRRVINVLERLAWTRGLPKEIVCDNGPEFTCLKMLKWKNEKGLVLRFIEPGKPIQNALVESFNGKFRDECLNENWFLNLNDARERVEHWRHHYNNERPHSSLGYIPPAKFARSHSTKIFSSMVA